LNDRQPNSPLTQFCAPYQETTLSSHNITGTSGTPYLSLDRFNNTYDLFNGTLSPEESITLNQRYVTKLNQVSFPSVTSIENYTTSSDIFTLYCNISETYYEKNDPSMIAASNAIVSPGDNPVEKAEKICNWVSNYLQYDGTLPSQEMGALWALNNQRGDCSEYSTLMITLLRCQGIPARKVTGFVLDNNPNKQPQIGETFKFEFNSEGKNTLLGHAWVEYYVEGVGWIACDPTWHGQVNYFNKIDYLRLGYNVGAWFSIPGGLPDVSEYTPQLFVYEVDSTFTFDYELLLTVIDSTLLQIMPIIIVSSIVGAVVLIAVIAIVLEVRKKKKRNSYYS